MNILKFSIYGRFVHFRKFYTNSSSLSYLIPPRTVIIGILASIMGYDRDSYYDVFSTDNIKVSVAISEGVSLRSQIYSVNYLHPKYYSFLTKGLGDKSNIHSQCKLELVMNSKGDVKYDIYIGTTNESSLSLINDLEEKITNRNFGYGIYFGQRQFSAYINDIHKYDESYFIESSEYIDSICLSKNVNSLSDNMNDLNIITDQMPINFCVSENGGRELKSIGRVIFEKSGKRIYGSFNNCYNIGEKIISFI